MKRLVPKGISALTPFPKSAAAATRCQGAGHRAEHRRAAERNHAVAGPSASRAALDEPHLHSPLWNAR